MSNNSYESFKGANEIPIIKIETFQLLVVDYLTWDFSRWDLGILAITGTSTRLTRASTLAVTITRTRTTGCST